MRILAGMVLATLASVFLLGSCSREDVTLSPPAPDALRIATYNVHYIDLGEATGAWSVGDWDLRKEPLDAAFKALSADAVAFQEMESFSRGSDGSMNLTLDWLRARNPGYGAAAVGNWRDFPSTQPILYRRDRLELLDQGWFFFSETPDVIYSRTFNGSYPAFASMAHFKDRRGGAAFHLVNVHFEFKSRSNRRRSAELVAERIRPLIGQGARVFVVGDVNARRGSEPVEILKGAGLTFGDVAGSTYHFDRGLDLFGAIDHLAASDGIVPVADPVVLRWRFDGEWPTDHYPVIGDFRLE